MKASAQNLRSALVPRSLALVGATDRHGALGRDVLRNLLAGGFQGAIHAVNPKHRRVGELPCYPSLGDLPAPPDLVVIVTPAATVPDVVEQAAGQHIPAVLVLSAGFAEAGSAGAALQARWPLAAAAACGSSGPTAWA